MDRNNAYMAIDRLINQENEYFEKYKKLNPSDGIRARQHETIIGAYITVMHELKGVN